MNKEKRLWPERDAETTSSEEGAIGYILLWLMGVPASILFLIFLLRGCN